MCRLLAFYVFKMLFLFQKHQTHKMISSGCNTVMLLSILRSVVKANNFHKNIFNYSSRKVLDVNEGSLTFAVFYTLVVK